LGNAQGNLSPDNVKNFKIPLPPLAIQEKIVEEINQTETLEQQLTQQVETLRNEVTEVLNNLFLKHPKQKIKNLADLNPSKATYIKENNSKTLVDFIAMASVSEEGIITKTETKTIEQVKTGYTFFQKNDVLFAKITPCMENGKGALVDVLKYDAAFGSTEFWVLRANKQILPKLLFKYTTLKSFRIEAEKNMTGTSGHRRVPKDFILNYEFPLPPLAEQEKIVTQITAIEKQIETLEVELNGLPAQKEGILKKWL